MSIHYETNQYGETVKVTRVGNSVSRELALPVAEPVLAHKRYTYAEFLEAVTAEEHVAFIEAAKTDAQLERFYELARVRNRVDFNDAATLAAAPYLVAQNILTQERLDALTG